MANAGDFQSIMTEYLACSRQQGKAYERKLGVRKNGGVALYGVDASLLSVAEILAVEPQGFGRKYRAEIGVLSNVNPSCPHCGYRFVYECPHCRKLSCCGDTVRHKCTWCGVVGTAEIQPERPERRTAGDVIWTGWIAFNEWVYDLMTRRNRPKTTREVEETFRKLTKP